MPDDPTLNAMVINGVMAPITATALKAAAPSSSVYTFTAAFSAIYRGQHLTYRKGQSESFDAATRAFLIAANAPITLA